MDPVWLVIALALGLAAQRVFLPPLVGFLAAGFVLHAFGEQGGAILDGAARLGVLLLRRGLLTPDEVMRLPEDAALIFVPGAPPILGGKIRYYEDATLAGRATGPT